MAVGIDLPAVGLLVRPEAPTGDCSAKNVPWERRVIGYGTPVARSVEDVNIPAGHPPDPHIRYRNPGQRVRDSADVQTHRDRAWLARSGTGGSFLCRARTLFVPVVAMASCLILPPVGRHEAAQEPKKIAGSDWPMAAKDYANTRYSELDQITAENVKDLKLAWTFDTGVHRGQEAAPIVVGDTMYVVTPFPNILYAFDLTKPGGGEVEVRAEARARRQGRRVLRLRQPRGRVRRRPVFITTLDCHVCGVDAATGKELWKTKVGDINMRRDDHHVAARREGQGARRQQRRRVRRPRVDQGARRGDRRRSPGRAYSTGPDADVLIGAEVQAVLRAGPGQGPGREDLAAGAVEDRRRHRLGLGLLRPRIEPDLPRHRQPRRVEPRTAARRQQVDLRRLRPRPGHRRGPLVLPVEPARPVRPRRRQRERAGRPRRSTARSREGDRSTPSATATSTCSTAPPARCSPPTPFVRITASKGVDLQDGPADPQRGEEAEARAR